MSRTLGMLVAIGLAFVARGDVRVFVTPASQGYGLTIPANAHRPTFSTVDAQGNNLNAYDYYYSQHPELPGGAAGHYFSVAAYPPIDAPLGTSDDPIEIAAGDFAYIWFQFVDEPKHAKVNGLVVEINGSHSDFVSTYYLQNDLGNGDDPTKRWEGMATPPDYPEWHNPPYLVCVTSSGVCNTNDDPQMMFENQAGSSIRTGVALLGAAQLNSYGTYSIEITALSYASGIPGAVADPSYFTYVPEPAACWMVAGMIALALRRRG